MQRSKSSRTNKREEEEGGGSAKSKTKFKGAATSEATGGTLGIFKTKSKEAACG
jgi:hypothetical protein